MCAVAWIMSYQVAGTPPNTALGNQNNMRDEPWRARLERHPSPPTRPRSGYALGPSGYCETGCPCGQELERFRFKAFARRKVRSSTGRTAMSSSRLAARLLAMTRGNGRIGVSTPSILRVAQLFRSVRNDRRPSARKHCIYLGAVGNFVRSLSANRPTETLNNGQEADVLPLRKINPKIVIDRHSGAPC